MPVSLKMQTKGTKKPMFTMFQNHHLHSATVYLFWGTSKKNTISIYIYLYKSELVAESLIPQTIGKQGLDGAMGWDLPPRSLKKKTKGLLVRRLIFRITSSKPRWSESPCCLFPFNILPSTGRWSFPKGVAFEKVCVKASPSTPRASSKWSHLTSPRLITRSAQASRCSQSPGSPPQHHFRDKKQTTAVKRITPNSLFSCHQFVFFLECLSWEK